jgi:transcriptional regulator with XRE-family HTH domain
MDEVRAIRAAFALRMNELADDIGVPRRGRQTALGKTFGVTPKAARKWLTGEGLPELGTAVAIANRAGVNVVWLLQGVGPKRGQAVDGEKIALTEGIDELPQEDRQQVLDFIGFKFSRADGWFVGEKLARYMKLLDNLSRKPPRSTDDSPPG